MNLSILLKDYATFNVWANQHIVDWLRAKPEALLEQEVPSSFPTLRLTLLHIWSAENVWLQRLQGISPKQFISEEFKGNLPELFAGLLQNSANFRDFLIGQPDPDFFHQQASYTHTNGTPYTQYRAEMILHCMQHSTYHRGQIITIARNLDITDVPKTDYIEYVRGKG